VDEAFKNEEHILNGLVNQADKSFVVSNNDATGYIEQILGEITK